MIGRHFEKVYTDVNLLSGITDIPATITYCWLYEFVAIFLFSNFISHHNNKAVTVSHNVPKKFSLFFRARLHEPGWPG